VAAYLVILATQEAEITQLGDNVETVTQRQRVASISRSRLKCRKNDLWLSLTMLE
jgi:hypothetical protein